MQLTIFRGSKEVGGSCLEVQSGTTRIILDVGMPIFDENRQPYDRTELSRMTTTRLEANGIAPCVPGLFSGKSQPDAILLSHAHLDHVGLLEHTVSTIPVYASKGTSKMMLVGEVFANQSRIPDGRHREVHSGRQVTIGDFTITPLAVDHSIHGCLAFLIEAAGKRLLYTGDLRLHGNRPDEHESIIETLRGSSLDALIVEGTHFGLDDGNATSEAELEIQITWHVEDALGLVLAAFSPQHMDRLRAFIHAAKETGRTFVADVYTAFTLYMASYEARLENPLTSGFGRVYYPLSEQRKIEQRGPTKVHDMFRNVEIQMDEILETPESHLMVFRESMLEDFADVLPNDSLCIYSKWQGYSRQDKWQKVESAFAATNGRIVHAHTSGHALSADIVNFTRAINAKTIIPIHTFEPEKFREHFDNVFVATDGQPINL